MSENTTVLDFVRFVLEQLCEQKSAIVLEQNQDEFGDLITIRVAEVDMGRLIGKQGQTISALRTLVRTIGAREEMRVNLKVLEPEAL